MEVEWADHDADVAAAGHGLCHQGQTERRAGHAPGQAEAANRKHLPEGLQLAGILQPNARFKFFFCLLSSK